ncbi:hypothetical protein ASF43_05335 [Pseudorhodoferax sp. Leaf267]|nr:DUF72 domain-containing protein [Pseudorhodoferax sp. Leaf267]KQP23655.1 hypothetical protein ASF43_05335 [Pseudorhodoferax sp. Leaf267]
MPNTFVGTASWTDKTLIDCQRFYPRKTMSAEARLRHYATQFPMVEVDSSYYAMPTPDRTQAWAERTPSSFVFNIKAFRLFTLHQTPVVVLHQDIQQALAPFGRDVFYYRDLPGEIVDELWRRFLLALEPLRASGKLQAVHFQFAPWVKRNRPGRLHVEECVQRMAGYRLAVEFRDETWFRPENAAATLDWERELGLVHVVVDGPQGFANSVPALWEATNPELAILRLHGRNTSSWNVKGLTAASDRFNYDYSDEELSGFVPDIVRLAERVTAMHVVFNNNMEDQGQRNGRALMRLLGDRAVQPEAMS